VETFKIKKLRRAATQRDHSLFFHIYLHDHAKYPTAPFQQKLFKLAQDDSLKFLVIEAFRGSAKSTIMALAYPIWSIIGEQHKKFILIICQTQAQARQTLKNIKDELTDNKLLKRELGPFDEPDDEWRANSIVIPKFGARITAVSLDTSVRGMKHGSYRPDLIICDDLEDLASVKVKDNRDKLYKWFFGDLMPMGDISTKVVVIGTRLHDDSLLMRLKEDIISGALSGTVRSYPLINDKNKIAWPGKFPNMAAIESLRKTIPSIQSWSREYLLKIIDDEETVVRRDWIKRYTNMPSIEDPDFFMTLTGVDLAITEDTKADCTAAVSMSVFRDRDGAWKAYVHPFPLNDQIGFPDARARLKMISKVLGHGQPTPLYIESVQYQKAMPQDLRHDGFPAEEFKVHGQDKRMRLSLITHLIQEGIILFPESGCEELLSQLINFGAERHDDLADAFAIAAHIVMEKITNPSYIMPSLTTATTESADEDALRENDIWFANMKIAWQQGRLPREQWFEAQEIWRVKKIEIETRVARAQKKQEADDEDRRMKLYNQNVYEQLMRKRRG
jgi:phage terminase large subunit-like protein